jgi:predicted dehydrogenase
MTEPVTLGILGWGNFSSHIHEQTVRDLIAEGRCRLRAVCVRTPATRAAILARLPADYGCADYQEVLADPQVQAVIIGAPHAVQARMAIDAVAAGKYVYVEKPTFAEAAETGAPARAFYDEFTALGRPALERLVVGLNKRFAPAYRELRDLCRTEWGGVRYLQMTIVDDAWRWNAGRYPPGFLLWLDIAHWLDLARWFTGAEVASLSALEPQVEDSLVTLRLTDGTVASIFLGGNVTMDVMKEELRVTTASRRSARVIDFLEMERFGGATPEVQSYRANQQNGGDESYVAAIDAGGLAAFRRIRREVFDRFTAGRGADPGGDDRVRRNIPNFMRPQGWRESLREFVATAAAGGSLSGGATYRDAYIAYELLDTIRASLAADGQFVPAVTVAND